MSTEKGWNTISKAYQEKTRISLNDVHWGPISAGESSLRLLGNVKNKDILEIGCGGGQNAIVLKTWGARPVGLDISQEQLKHARKLAKKEGVEVQFVHGNMENLSRFENESFDIILSAFGMGYSENLTKTIRETYRVLRKNGLLVFAEVHPIAERGRPIRHGKARAWKMLDYFNREKHKWTWKIGDAKTKFNTHWRTLQDYFDLLVETGYIVERILEPQPFPLDKMTLEERDKTAPYMGDGERNLKNFDIWKKIPFTIIFKARKI